MAGLLDLLSPGSDGGGLLDFLKRNANAAIADTPTGAPGDTANYGGTGAPIFNPQQAPPGQPIAPTLASSNAMAQAPVPQNPPAVIPATSPTPAPSGDAPGFMTA